MNNNILKGNWDQLKGQVKKTWGKISDKQLDTIEGDFDKFVGAIEKAYGYTNSQATNSVKDFLNKEERSSAETPVGAQIRKAGEIINEFSETVAAKSDRVVHKGEDVVGSVQKNVSKYIDIAVDYTKEHPMKVTLIAVGVGFLFGKLLRK